MITIKTLTKKIITALYNYYMKENPLNYLSTSEIVKKMKMTKYSKEIYATLIYLIELGYVSESTESDKEFAYRLTPKGIDYYEDGLTDRNKGGSSLTVKYYESNGAVGNNYNKNYISVNKSKLTKSMKKRIFTILEEVGEMVNFLKMKDLLSQKDEKKFKDWFSEVENIINIHDLGVELSEKS